MHNSGKCSDIHVKHHTIFLCREDAQSLQTQTDVPSCRWCCPRQRGTLPATAAGADVKTRQVCVVMDGLETLV